MDKRTDIAMEREGRLREEPAVREPPALQKEWAANPQRVLADIESGDLPVETEITLLLNKYAVC